jgi:hypothetical protein
MINLTAILRLLAPGQAVRVGRVDPAREARADIVSR